MAAPRRDAPRRSSVNSHAGVLRIAGTVLGHDGVEQPAEHLQPDARLGQIDAANLGQLVGRESVEERRRHRPLHDMLGECGGVRQAGGVVDGLGLGVLPPAAAVEAARIVVVKALRELNNLDAATRSPGRTAPAGGLTVIGARGSQRTRGEAFLVAVMQSEDVVIGLLVLTHRRFGSPTRPEAVRVEAGHVDLDLALVHQIRQGIIAEKMPKLKPLANHILLRPGTTPTSGFQSWVWQIGPLKSSLRPTVSEAGMRWIIAMCYC